ncbi:hypothetical protein H5410_037099 [Solanum commersonii]|uniref:At2g35280-like TPR domain-containing protein n=1 Tax=Solanum commersonii TaxID=4109 RepID=A0A9J5Y5B8_SOLCO|nr:hypothetical protein H5410_037099 [Solanum commersonii]
MRVKLRVLNQVANEPSVYQKVTLVNIPYCRWSIVQEAISFLEMCRASGNLEALTEKFDFFNLNDPTALGMISQAADGGHIGASYVLAIISIFNDSESMREGLMFIANMKKTESLKEDPFVALFINLSKSDAGMVGPWEATMQMIIVYDFFKRSDSNGLGILSKAANGGHIGASYVLAIILIFNGGESKREGLMFIANMTSLKLRRCREKLRNTLYGWVPEPHLLGKRPICCTVQSLHFHCTLCRCDLEIDEVVKFLY